MSCSISISLIRPSEGSRARAFRPLPGARRSRSCRFAAGRWSTPGGGRERPRRGPAGTVPVASATGGGQPDVGIQGGEQPAARPGGLPPRREHGGLTPGRHFQEMHLDQLGHARRGAQRADQDQARQDNRPARDQKSPRADMPRASSRPLSPGLPPRTRGDALADDRAGRRSRADRKPGAITQRGRCSAPSSVTP